MCGRFAIARDPAAILAELEAEAWPDQDAYEPHWNLAPTMPAPLLFANGARELRLLRWGLVPFWADDPAIGNRLINARGESVHRKPAFRHLVDHHRAVVVADGFYEWRREGGGKQPWFVRPPDASLCLMAALWDHWQGADGPAITTFTIITTAPNAQVARLHDRMPAILPRDQVDCWLRGPRDQALQLLRPFPGDLTMYRVGTAVNRPGNDGPDLVEPLPEQGQLF